jgi:Beta-propeller repeat
MTTISGFNSSLLLSYFQAQDPNSTASASSASTSTASSSTSSNSATANDDPPWDVYDNTSQQVEDAKILSTTNFMNTSSVPLSPTPGTGGTTEQDNQKLFALYTAINNLSYLAKMSTRSGMTSGQLEGFNTRFQEGLQQVESYLSSTSFNNFTLQAAATSSSVTSTAEVPNPTYSYTTQSLTTVNNNDVALSDLSTSDSFTINVKVGNNTTAVPIDLSQVQGNLTLPNIITYANQQLAADGFKTKLSETITQGTIDDPDNASYGLEVTPSPNETITFSASNTQPALYLVGTAGNPTAPDLSSTATTTTTTDDQQARITKLTNLSSSPQGDGTATVTPTTGNTTAQASAVDSQGNIYVLGNATGDFGDEINQGSQDVYLTKYDSAGNVEWTQLVGASSTASGYSLALDNSGNVYVAGSTTSDLTSSAVADGNTDSFVAKYDSTGDQLWTQQLQTLNANQANAITVDGSGNVIVGGQVTGTLEAGQTNSGNGDAYLAVLNSNGTVKSEQQFGTSGADQVSAVTTGSDGSLYVASVQNGEAIVSKYANGNITSTPEWSEDLGAVQAGGTISSIAVSGDQVYLSGTTSNGNLTANGTATIASTSSGGTDAYVFNLTDNGANATANYVSYLGTSAKDTGGSLTVGSDGTIYLAGTTYGTFNGQSRTTANVPNAFVASVGSGGAINWVRQYGGTDGQSTGTSVAIDPNGGSVLDALGLPDSPITLNQSFDLTQATTLRAGDTFQMKIGTGSASRTTTITIDPGETLDTLTAKINAELGTSGKATVNYTDTGEGLTISANAGQTIDMIAGPSGTDALSRLGIATGVISKAAASSSKSSTTTATPSSATSGTPSYGLGLTTTMDISTTQGANMAKTTLLTVLGQITNIYQQTNTSPSSSSGTSASGGPSSSSSGATTAQIQNYNVAAAMLSSWTPVTISTKSKSSKLI